MDIQVREYKDFDKDILLKLIEELQDFVALTDPMMRLRRLPEYGESYLKKTLDAVAKNNGKIYMAEGRGKVIGFISGGVKMQTEENLLEVVPTKTGVIFDLFIEENYRGQNIGTKLLEEIEKYFKSKSCDILWLEVFEPNKIAHEAYLKFGFIDRNIHMLKKL